MAYYQIVNWREFQHYTDRSPPWIKLHRDILTSRTWVMGTNDDRVLAVACMLVAADTENKIPVDLDYIKRRAYLSESPDLDRLVSLQFLVLVEEPGDIASGCKRMLASARPETETETEKNICSSAIHVRFQEFWNSYPRKQSKADATKAFRNLSKTDQLAAIHGLTMFEFSGDRQYQPLPATWIRKRRWEDERVNGEEADPFNGAWK